MPMVDDGPSPGSIQRGEGRIPRVYVYLDDSRISYRVHCLPFLLTAQLVAQIAGYVP